jgi:serine/threonine-protein kinase RsbW
MPGIDISSDITAVGKLTDWLSEAASIYLDRKSVEDLQIATTEAVNNIILHAYRGRPGRPISVSLDIDDDHVELVLRDRGDPLPPSVRAHHELADVAEPGPIDSLPESGLGLMLIRQCVDDLRYRRVGDWNELCLSFLRSNLPRKPGTPAT